jgi:DNA replication protein DnaC
VLSRSHTWLLQAENQLLFGPSGVGKTHLAIAITMAMTKQDQACRFFPANALVQLLQKAKASYELPALIQKLDRYALLVIDDTSYVRRSELETSVLFELIYHRYEGKSPLVTSNQPFREWDEIFPSGSMTVAAVDRLVHHGHIVGIMGESYRQKAVAARVSSDQSDPPRSLTRASGPSRSTAAVSQRTRSTAATRKLAHPPRQADARWTP